MVKPYSKCIGSPGTLLFTYENEFRDFRISISCIKHPVVYALNSFCSSSLRSRKNFNVLIQKIREVKVSQYKGGLLMNSEEREETHSRVSEIPEVVGGQSGFQSFGCTRRASINPRLLLL